MPSERLAVKQPQLQLQIVELREMLWVPNAGCQLFGEIRAKWARARVTYFIARDKNWEGYLLGKKQKSLPFRIVQYLFAGSRCWVERKMIAPGLLNSCFFRGVRFARKNHVG
jgi:hypothetical protein